MIHFLTAVVATYHYTQNATEYLSVGFDGYTYKTLTSLFYRYDHDCRLKSNAFDCSPLQI